MYADYVNRLFEENGWDKVAENFKDIKGKKVLIFTHDDPDGLTSGCILKRLVESLSAEAVVKIPQTYELEETRLNNELGKDNYDMVILSDKGTMGYYDNYVDKINKFVIIDHHPPIGEVNKCLLINPNIKTYNSTSTSFMAHMLMTYLGKGDKYDDFLALMGLKGDWAVEPATGFVSDYVKDFYEEKIVGTYDNFIAKIQSRPTMFEVSQRKNTTLINQIAELYFALGGGGFQYFYNDRAEKLKDINQSAFSFDMLDKHAEKFTPAINGLDEYIESTDNSEIVKLIYKYFLEDWEIAIKSFSSACLLAEFEDTNAYFFLGWKVPLMPMAGSVYLDKLKEVSKEKEVVFIMLNREAEGGIHFSVRGTADSIHSGKICSNLAKRLVEKYNDSEQITGGGHYRAAECKTRESGVTLAQALEVFAVFIMDMEKAAKSQDKENGVKLGLEYLGVKE